jgi:S1-C subfamily serine protease
MSELNAEKERYKAGDKIKLTVYRDGKSMDFDVTLMEDKPAK